MVFEVVNMLGPNLLGPETAAVIVVFADVANYLFFYRKRTMDLRK